MNDEFHCRGCYVLGSACGQCSRCEKELLDLIEELTDKNQCHVDGDFYCSTHKIVSITGCPHGHAQLVLKCRKARKR